MRGNEDPTQPKIKISKIKFKKKEKNEVIEKEIRLVIIRGGNGGRCSKNTNFQL